MFPVRFYTYSINAASAPNIFRTSFGAVLRMNFESMKFHFTVSSCWMDGWTDSHTSLTLCISWAPDDPLAISKTNPSEDEQPHLQRTTRKNVQGMPAKISFFTLQIPLYIYKEKLCLNYLSKLLGKHSNHKPILTIKYCNLYLK